MTTEADVQNAFREGQPVPVAVLRSLRIKVPAEYVRNGLAYEKVAKNAFPSWIWDLGDTTLAERVRQVWAAMAAADLVAAGKRLEHLRSRSPREGREPWSSACERLRERLDAMGRAEAVFESLVTAVGASLEGYHADLLTHDRQAIIVNPGVPWVHWTRRLGTSIHALFPAGSEVWPKVGEKVPYLFGVADREHILSQGVEVGRYFERSFEAGSVTARHYDGCGSIEAVTLSRATSIIGEWQRSVQDAWRASERARPALGVPRI